MEPLITLSHWELPGWLADEGGYTAPVFVDAFAKYADHVIRRFSKDPLNVTWWMTFNEPIVVLSLGYVYGAFPPGKVADMRSFNIGRYNMAKAHVRIVDEARHGPQGANLKFSVSAHLRDFQPILVDRSELTKLNPKKDLDAVWKSAVALDGKDLWENYKRYLGKVWKIVKAPRKNSELYLARYNKGLAEYFHQKFNEEFLDALAFGNMKFKIIGNPFRNAHFVESIEQPITLPEGKSTLDYLGINYYGRYMVSARFGIPITEGNEGPKSDFDWEVYPQGLYNVSKWSWERYHLPILIAENGLADEKDTQRGQFIRDHVAQIKKLRDEGVNVFGYLHWSLTDNLEWSEGLRLRYGLVAIDYKSKDAKGNLLLTRVPRGSFYEYQKIIANGEP